MSSIDYIKKLGALLLLASIVPLLFWTTNSHGAQEWKEITSLIGLQDALLVSDPDGKIIISKNETKKLIPASILKIFTSLVALYYLSEDYRYPTEFFFDKTYNLKIKGYGDPLLVSEVVGAICNVIASLISTSKNLNDLILDHSFFEQPLTIPGISSSAEPYDAPNGALCVNFNTVNFKRTKAGYVSAEPQTPLLPFAKKKIIASKLKSGRIVLSHIENENTIYAGKLFQYFLRQQAIHFKGTVKLGQVNQLEDQIIYRYVSRFSLEQIIAKLLEHSNNFTTNQLLISSGVKAFGQPGNLKKGVAAAKQYARRVLQIKDMEIVEGSGISRKNKVSAQAMLRILEEFEPHHLLMHQEGREFYKTGTLYGIRTRAGYISSKRNGLYRYVVMMNTPGKSTTSLIHRLLRILE
ncbi:MAG: D-alanyl-D-alanine carboxypeptidase [Desulfobacterales bacterium]|jgi:D-alanyl-D-alanine carboxypeptidase/D-alanyl-D-alanine-endopeptidase (penicillin-binding protein 4)